MTPGPGIEPGTHWWEASALTTAPSLLPYNYTCYSFEGGGGGGRFSIIIRNCVQLVHGTLVPEVFFLFLCSKDWFSPEMKWMLVEPAWKIVFWYCFVC